MASPFVQIDGFFVADEVDAALADIELRAKRLAPAFRGLRKPMRADQKDHARKAEGPDGKWEPRSPATIARYKRQKKLNKRRRESRAASRLFAIRSQGAKARPIAKALLGRLPRALNVTYTDLSITAESMASFGFAHNAGGWVGHHHLVKLPRRTFVWISDPLLNYVASELTKHILKGWKR